jgi:ribose transport system ATP-binding protein
LQDQEKELGVEGNSLVLEIKRISKHFGAVEALKDVDLKCYTHSIHAIVGENGAGKSTLIKIIAGVIQPNAGSIFYNKKPVRFFSPIDALNSSIVSVFQELSIIPDLTVAENICIVSKRKYFTSTKQQRRRAEEIFARMKCEDIDPRELCSNLSLSRLQLVEIAKALNMRPRILILDEATSALTGANSEKIFLLLKDLREEGVSMLYITHHLREIEIIADMCSVFRNGERVDTFKQGDRNQAEIVKMMIGRPLSKMFPEKRKEKLFENEAVLQVEHLDWYERLRDISFTVNKGEIVGIGGIAGQGQGDLLYSLFGVLKNVKGNIHLMGEKISLRSPSTIIKNRKSIVMIPEDRKSEGLFLSMSILKNISIAALGHISKGALIERHKELEKVNEMVNALRIRIGSVNDTMESLSGGNQQKVVLAKWLMLDAKCILLMDPTRGIDVGTKQEIYVLLRNLADNGTSILFYSTDYDELIGLCDRVLIMYKGEIVRILIGDEITDNNILTASLNLKPEIH